MDLRLTLTVGAERFDLKGRAYQVRFYETLYDRIGGLDFLIFNKPEQPDLMIMNMPKVFYRGNEGPVEPILPGDANYPEVLEEEPRA